MTYQEGNIIIAKYLGWTVYADKTFTQSLRVNTRSPEGTVQTSTTYKETIPVEDQLKYAWNDLAHENYGRCGKFNQSWDKLIPVVKKVLPELNALIEFPDNGEPDEISNKANIAAGRITGALIDLEIEEVWKEVIIGIQALNKQKEDKDGKNG